ncbi:hypothetical protein CDL12_20344 [Handroanthus impetiginosus]|uniref:GATA-type domain-containing protein n=1 Tax=Handroanthus impetiginosus TaxID=429701 RepID=A0A2G9GPE3_9LAMI|nr:hypothetical protein CDL12_20344 [Handroanthus impetiginosus]
MMQRCSSNDDSYNSMFFSMPNGGQYTGYDEEEMYPAYTTSSPPSSSVDCTLSLGTPSTRLTNEKEKKRSSCTSSFGWNIMPSKNAQPSSAGKSHRSGSNGNAASGGDPLLARRCANCDTTSTPLWRNGPRGPKSLCNACGIRYKKEERRATAAAAAASSGADDTQQMMDNSWVQSQRMGYYSPAYANEYRFMEEDDSYHTWRFNVPVHDFTR